MPKNPVEPVEADELVVVDEPLELEDAPLADVPDAVVPIEGPAAAAPGKKPVGVKEVIPFAWKLVGQANGLYLTLFKSIEREDSDAQLERVQRDGYYTNLRVMPVNEKIEQPKPPKSSKKTDSEHSREALKTVGTRTVAKETAPTKEAKAASAKSAKEAKAAERPPERILITSKIPLKPKKAAASRTSAKSARSSKSAEPAATKKKKPAASKRSPKKAVKTRK